jgi:sugar phosphate isomerase/epimerase
VAELVKKVGHPRMGLIFEACNEYRGCLKWKIGSETALRSDPTELLIDSLIQVAPLVRDVHVRDAVPTNDGEWVPLGEGVIDWARLLAALDGCNYSGPLTVEHHLPAKQAATMHTVDTLRALIQAI